MLSGRDPIAEEYADVLQNLEFAVVLLYRQHPELLDHQVNKVIEGLERSYTTEMNGRKAPNLRLAPLEAELFDKLKVLCDWRLGRATQSEAGLPEEVEALDVDEIILCLKRILRSIKLWTKEYGMRGYLDYVNQFFPAPQSE